MSDMFLFEGDKIVRCLGDGLDVVLPDRIEEVDLDAFEGIRLRSLTVPAKLIRSLAQGGHPTRSIYGLNCETLIFERGIKVLSGITFVETKVGKVVFYEGLQKIERPLFANGKCEIGEMIMPDSVTELGASFYNVVFGKIQFSRNLKKTEKCPFSECSFNDLIVETALKKLEESSFIDCRAENAVIGDGIEIIGVRAFAGFHCKTIRLPKTLKKIQAKAFINSDIREIVLPDSVSSVDNAAFAYCGSERIVLSPSLKKIQPHVFDGCPNLKELVLPTGVETLNLSAISDCPRLKKLTLPPSLKEILSFGTGYVSAIEEIVNLSPLPITKAQFPKLKYLKTSPDD